MKKKFYCWADTMELKEVKILRIAQYNKFIFKTLKYFITKRDYKK